jgi:hypothetical protein
MREEYVSERERERAESEPGSYHRLVDEQMLT